MKPSPCFSMYFLMVCSLLLPTPLGQKRTACWDTAVTQLEMNDCAVSELKKADIEMNRVYRQLVHKHQGEVELVEKLGKAQRAWLAYKDAQLESLFPATDPQSYGSVRPMCVAIVLKALTEERTRALKSMLNVKEGEVCADARFRRQSP